MSKNTVNEFVRRKVRELRKSRKMKIREIATLTGMPYSSRCCTIPVGSQTDPSLV